MSFVTRKSGLDVAVFSLGGTEYLCDLDNATINVEIDEEDARGVCDDWKFAWATAKGWSLDGELFVASVAPLMADIISGDALVTVSFNTGGNTYTGNALIKSAGHSAGKTGLQKVSAKLSGQGALTVS